MGILILHSLPLTSARRSFLVLSSLLFFSSPSLLARTQLSGHVIAWGYNFFGQTNVPPALDGVVAVAAGLNHSLALRANGTVVAWGDNAQGQANVPANLTDVIAISAAAHSVGLKSDGTVVVWGAPQASVTTVPPTAVSVKAIATGSGGGGNIYTLALRTDGTVVAWGNGGAETNVPVGLDGVTAIAAGSYHCLAMKSNGTVVAWGLNERGQATPPPNLTGVVAIRAGQMSSFALKSDGSVIKWGGDEDNNLPPGLGPLTDLQVGLSHAIGLRADGTVLGWGFSLGVGTLSGLPAVFAISTKGNHNLAITREPLIISISPSLQGSIGGTATFSVVASGEQLSYQWQHNGTNLPLQSSTTLTLSNLQTTHAGVYTVIVSNPFGSVVSPERTLSFPPPVITSSPQPLQLTRGETATFEVTATGLQPLIFQWARDGAAILNVSSPILTIPFVRLADSGSYSVKIIDAAGGSTTTSPVALTVSDPRLISLSLIPSADTSIFSSGSNPQGEVSILAGTRLNGVRDRGLIRFDLSSLPAGAQLESCSFTINTSFKLPRAPANSDFALYRLLVDWANSATWFGWGSPGGTPGIDFSSAKSAVQFVIGFGSYEFAGPGLFEDVRSWMADPASNKGWLLKSESEQVPGTARHFASGESATPPHLLLNYVLPPAAPKISDPQLTAQELHFNLEAAAGWIYHVEFRENVADGDWTTIQTLPAGPDSRLLEFRIPLTSAHGFYRLLVE
jgi:alpha-tubulin suppressor-like RCC1 family protein